MKFKTPLQNLANLLILTGSLLSTGIFADITEVRVLHTEVFPAAKEPAPADDTVLVTKYRSFSQSVRPIKRCLLVHGYGMANKTVELLKLPLMSQLYLNSYFGDYLISGLAKNACDEVVMTITETAQTSLLEYTRKIERVLKDSVCNVAQSELAENQKPCALVGHSLGGAVATAIARRCMEAENGESELAESGCRGLAKIYSLAGDVTGTTATALLAGARKLKDTVAISDLDSVIHLGIVTLLEQAAQVQMNIVGDFIPGRTNPLWLDLGPAAPMEKNLPLYAQTHDLVLEKRGWLEGDYAASAGIFAYKDINEVQTVGCGQRRAEVVFAKPAIRFAALTCKAFGAAAGRIHLPSYRSLFEDGVADFGATVAGLKDLSKGSTFTWQNFQQSDGLVDKETALRVCLNSEKTDKNPRGAATHCQIFDNVNHLAMSGGALEVADDVIAQLAQK